DLPGGPNTCFLHIGPAKMTSKAAAPCTKERGFQPLPTRNAALPARLNSGTSEATLRDVMTLPSPKSGGRISSPIARESDETAARNDPCEEVFEPPDHSPLQARWPCPPGIHHRSGKGGHHVHHAHSSLAYHRLPVRRPRFHQHG